MSELMTLDEIAEWLGVHKATVRRWVRERGVPKVRLGHRTVRYRIEDVVAHFVGAPQADEQVNRVFERLRRACDTDDA